MGSGSPDRWRCLLPNVRLQLSLPRAVFPSLPEPEPEAHTLPWASALRARGCSLSWGTSGSQAPTLEMLLYLWVFPPSQSVKRVRLCFARHLLGDSAGSCGPCRCGCGPWWRPVCSRITGLPSLGVPGPRTRCQLMTDIRLLPIRVGSCCLTQMELIQLH